VVVLLLLLLLLLLGLTCPLLSLSSAQPEGLLCSIDNTNSCLQDFLPNLSDLCIVPAFELALLQDGRWGCCLPAAAAAEPLPGSSAAVLC
jgi:hypothetical protein